MSSQILDRARENLLRLMAGGGLTIRQMVGRTGLDQRTIRGILAGTQKPHAQTLNRLAEGFGVNIDEFFVEPAQLLYRRFDRQTNPIVAEVLDSYKELFQDWNETNFNELYSMVGRGGAMTFDGVLAAVRNINRKRKTHEKLDLLLESSYSDLAAELLNVLYRKVVASEGSGEDRGVRASG